MGPAVLILGLGNPLRGDDGVGPRVVADLVRRGLPEGAVALDGGTGGLDLLRILDDQKRVIIVDAADVGQAPGRFVRFTLDQARLALAGDGFSVHRAGLAEALALADALGQSLPDMVIFGVQPALIDWRDGLSPAVEAILPTLVDAVLDELKGDIHAQDTGD